MARVPEFETPLPPVQCTLYTEPNSAWDSSREYELITKACAQLSVVETAPDSLSLCVLGGGGEKAGGRGVVSSSRGRGTDNTQGERIWSRLGRQKVKRGLLSIIHILWTLALNWQNTYSPKYNDVISLLITIPHL